MSIRQSISASRSTLGMTNFPIDKEKYLTYNSRVQPVARESDELSLTDLNTKPHCVIGTEVGEEGGGGGGGRKVGGWRGRGREGGGVDGWRRRWGGGGGGRKGGREHECWECLARPCPKLSLPVI